MSEKEPYTPHSPPACYVVKRNNQWVTRSEHGGYDLTLSPSRAMIFAEADLPQFTKSRDANLYTIYKLVEVES